MPEAFCGLETVRKKVLLNLWVLWEKEIPFVREGTLQRLSWLLSHPEGAFYFSQKYTEEQNTQHSTETLSQLISQNLTAIFGSNALWILYAGGVLWHRNCAQKGSVKSVSSVREQNIHHERKECLLWEKKLPSVKEKPSHAPHKQASRGNLTYYSPPYGGGDGGGASSWWGFLLPTQKKGHPCECP